MKHWDFAIGNPPYMETTESDSTRMPPVYNMFMDEAFKVADTVELITPARFLFNTGFTPKAWNEKMLSDEHFKILQYEADSSKIFPSATITGGLAVSYRNANKKCGAIGTYSKYAEVNAILQKVKYVSSNFMDEIVYPSLNYGVSDQMKQEHPDLLDRLRTSAFTTLSDLFFEQPPKDGHSYIAIRMFTHPAKRRTAVLLRIRKRESRREAVPHEYNDTGRFLRIRESMTVMAAGCFEDETAPMDIDQTRRGRPDPLRRHDKQLDFTFTERRDPLLPHLYVRISESESGRLHPFLSKLDEAPVNGGREFAVRKKLLLDRVFGFGHMLTAPFGRCIRENRFPVCS